MKSPMEALRRRKLFQWGLGYGTAAWLVAQILDVAADPWGLSAGVVRTMQMVLAFGFPIALVLAWYHGEKGRQRVSGREALLLVALVAIGAIGLTLTNPMGGGEPLPESPAMQTTDASAVHPHSIVVLPFRDFSQNGDQEYLAYGVAEELLNLLTRIPELRVISRASAFSFADQGDLTLPEIATRLGAAHVLDGSVRTAGDDVRISVQLIDTRTDTHLLSSSYDGTMTDIFALQDSIASDVVRGLRVTILGAPPTLEGSNPEAYGLFLLGRHVFKQRAPNWYRQSVDIFEQVLTVDPDHIPTLMELALVHYDQSTYDGNAGLDRERSEQLVNRVLALDPGSARAHGLRSALHHPEDLHEMAREMQLALDIAPGDPEMLMWAGMTLMLLGRDDEAVPFLEFKVDLDPLDPISLGNLAIAYANTERWEEAIAVRRTMSEVRTGSRSTGAGLAMLLLQTGDVVEAERVLETAPDGLVRRLGLALVDHANGRQEAFVRRMGELEREFGNSAPASIAIGYAMGRDVEAAFGWLDRLTPVTASTGAAFPISSRAEFKLLHNDPRWERFLERVGQSESDFGPVVFEPELPD